MCNLKANEKMNLKNKMLIRIMCFVYCGKRDMIEYIFVFCGI